MNTNIFYNDNGLPKKKTSYALITMSAILYSLSINIFYSTAGIFSAGIGSIAGLITYTNESVIPFFSIIYLVLNIPLIMIFWKKVKRKFIIRTTYFLLVQAAFGFIFINDDVANLTSTLFGSPKEIQLLSWPIFVLPLAGSAFLGLSIAIAYKHGASSGGTDIIVYYFSTKRKISIGKLAFSISILLVFFSFGTTVGIKPETRVNWYMTLLSTFTATALNAFVIDKAYPKYSKRHLEIHTSKVKEVEEYLRKNSYHTFFTIDVISGCTKKRKQVVGTTVLLLEIKMIRKNLFKIDPDIWISDSKVQRVFGNFQTSYVE